MTQNRNHLFQRFVIILLRQEVDISWRDDADQFAAHLASLGYRDSWEPVSDFCF